MAYDFDLVPERRGTNSVKWDGMGPIYGVDPADGLAMWVADMDFPAPPPVLEALQRMTDHGVFGYGFDDGPYRRAICEWMATRHDWRPEPEAIFTTNGLVNAVALCLDVYTAPGDAVVLMTPVYHAFARVIRGAGRVVTECPLTVDADGRQGIDTAAWEDCLTGKERMLILCSPHNPGGRVWTRDELEQIADFAARHDLTIISDEVHQDLVFSGAKHLPLPIAVPAALPRTVVLNAPSKTFNIAGVHIGQVIIPDADLRRPFAARMAALALKPSTVGMEMTRAAYTPESAEWLDALIPYLDGNRRVFDEGIASIPGLRSTRLEATYLSWVDFAGTGMTPAEAIARVQGDARVAPNHGESFGLGGESYLRFNIATSRARVIEAVLRLRTAFADLQ